MKETKNQIKIKIKEEIKKKDGVSLNSLRISGNFPKVGEKGGANKRPTSEV